MNNSTTQNTTDSKQDEALDLVDAPERVTLWICCHCQTPRQVGLTVCDHCHKRLHDTVEYTRSSASVPAVGEDAAKVRYEKAHDARYVMVHAVHPDIVVLWFLALKSHWFDDPDNLFYGQRELAKAYLYKWVETGEIADDSTTLEITTAMKFREWLESSWTTAAASSSLPAEKDHDSCSHWREGDSDNCVWCGDDLGPTTEADVASLPAEPPPTHPFGPCGYRYCDWPDGELRCNEPRWSNTAAPLQPECEQEQALRKKRARRIIDVVIASPCIVETRFFSQPEEQEKLENHIAALLAQLEREQLENEIFQDATDPNFTAAATPPDTPVVARLSQQVIATVLGFSDLDDLGTLAPDHPNRKYVESEITRIITRHLAAVPVGQEELVDEVQRRMDQVVEAAVEWHQAGREGGEWFDAAEKLSAVIDSLLDLRSKPATAAECFCGTELEAGLCPNGHDPVATRTTTQVSWKCPKCGWRKVQAVACGQCHAWCESIAAAATPSPEIPVGGEVRENRSNHFSDAAIDKGFPDHISRDGAAHYSDGTVLPAPVVSDGDDEGVTLRPDEVSELCETLEMAAGDLDTEGLGDTDSCIFARKWIARLRGKGELDGGARSTSR